MPQEFITFALERTQSLWENEVDYNLTESGVHPMTIQELVQESSEIEALLNMPLNYPQTNGIPELRAVVSGLYEGATRDHVLVTVGAIQANFSTLLTMLGADDELAVMSPNYRQLWGMAQNLGFRVKTFSLSEDDDWALDIDELGTAVNEKTKIIAICNPNNPTGHILTADERQAVIQAADRVGAWILADEVYAGSEHHSERETSSFYGEYDKVLAINSMSKAYGLPGLRLGWVVAPPDMIEEIWKRQEYNTIATTPLSNRLAAYALSPTVRPRIIERTRRYVREGFANFAAWMDRHGELFDFVPPEAAAIAFVRYQADVNSTELVDRLIREKSTFVVPGDAFGIDRHLRIAYGQDADYVNTALQRLTEVVMEFTR
jgi:hypothetical protein